MFRGGFATLTFTSQFYPNQLPITGYTIDWDDGNVTIATGIKINQNASPENPHTFYHYYNYWDVKNTKDCKDNICVVKPKIQIEDNWGWRNLGKDGNGEPFGGTIEIKERE